MRPSRNESLKLDNRLQQELGYGWPRKGALIGLFSFLILGIDMIDGCKAAMDLWQDVKSSESSSPKPLYDLPISKGPRSTLDSLELKHRDSLQDLEDVLRLRGRDTQDLATARSLLDRAFQNERRTASDELFSHLYTLDGDLLLREGKSAEAIALLEKACKLNPQSWEMPILLLQAYKAEHYRLQVSPPWPESRQRRIHELSKKIKILEEKLYPNLQSLMELLKDSSGRLELAAGAYSRSTGGGASSLASCNSDVGLHCWKLKGEAIFQGIDAMFNGCDGGGRFAYGNGDITNNNGANIACDTGNSIFHCHNGGNIGCSTGGSTLYSRTPPLPPPNACKHAGAHDTSTSTNCTGVLDLDGITGIGRNQVLAVGVNGGAHVGLDRVTHAAADALRVSVALRGLDFRSTVLVNHEATRSKVLAELAHAVQTSRPGDVFVFYFSGHGFTDANGHPLLVTGRGNPVSWVHAGKPATGDSTINIVGADKNVVNKGNPLVTLSLEEVVDVLSFHRGRTVVILDNCLNAMQLHTAAPRRMVAGPNRPTIILAGDPSGRVIESPQLGSGLFTYTLLRFLEQQRTPEIDFDAMFQYTAAETTRLARDLYGVSQRPQWLPVR